MSHEGWDYEGELDEDRRVERQLPKKEFIVFAIVMGVFAVRILLG